MHISDLLSVDRPHFVASRMLRLEAFSSSADCAALPDLSNTCSVQLSHTIKCGGLKLRANIVTKCN